MQEITLGRNCSREGDYLAWKDMKWDLKGEASIDLVNEIEVCEEQHTLNIYPAPFTSMQSCMRLTPRLNEKTDSGKTHLQDLARWWRTSQRVDIPKISQFYWALFEKTRFLCFYIIKSMARKGYFGPKSDFRGSKIPPRGASST